MSYTVIGQIIDTIKFHAYFQDGSTREEVEKYNAIVDELSEKKKEAQLINNSNNDLRFVNVRFFDSKFQVMATTVKSFAVTIKNGDVSISLKRVTLKKPKEDVDDKELKDSIVMHASKNPVIKAEFRSSFLVRTGYIEALRHVNKLISAHFIENFRPVISEIHIATDFQGYDFTHLDPHRFRTHKKRLVEHEVNSSIHAYGKRFSGFVLGSGNDMLRIYDKSLEISIFPDKEYIKDLIWLRNPKYDDEKIVWRVEAQYRRKTLKTLKTDDGVIDGYESVLNNIPSLWNRAVTNNQLLDIDRESAVDIMTNTTVKDGVEFVLMPKARTMRIYRAEVHPAWKAIENYNEYSGEQLDVYKAPRTGARQWVNNSVKSLFSTLLKHNGDITKEGLIEAFEVAEKEVLDTKGISLVENASLKHIDYFGQTKKMIYNGDSVYPASNELENFLPLIANELVSKLNLDVGSDEFYNQLYDKVGY